MTQDEEKQIITKACENIFTIDGRGRPAKAQLFLSLLDKYGETLVLAVVKEIGQRKAF